MYPVQFTELVGDSSQDLFYCRDSTPQNRCQNLQIFFANFLWGVRRDSWTKSVPQTFTKCLPGTVSKIGFAPKARLAVTIFVFKLHPKLPKSFPWHCSANCLEKVSWILQPTLAQHRNEQHLFHRNLATGLTASSNPIQCTMVTKSLQGRLPRKETFEISITKCTISLSGEFWSSKNGSLVFEVDWKNLCTPQH